MFTETTESKVIKMSEEKLTHYTKTSLREEEKTLPTNNQRVLSAP